MSKRATAKEAVDKERGQRLMQARKRRGATQLEMASYLGITLQAYQRYEYGNELRASVIIAICAKLECSPSWLLGIREDGEHLDTGDPLMDALRKRCGDLNVLGQKKVMEYADDLACNSRYFAYSQKDEEE